MNRAEKDVVMDMGSLNWDNIPKFNCMSRKLVIIHVLIRSWSATREQYVISGYIFIKEYLFIFN